MSLEHCNDITYNDVTEDIIDTALILLSETIDNNEDRSKGKTEEINTFLDEINQCNENNLEMSGSLSLMADTPENRQKIDYDFLERVKKALDKK